MSNVLIFLLGLLLGLMLSFIIWRIKLKHLDGVVVINQTDPNKDVVRIEMITSLSQWCDKKNLIFKTEQEK